ncbi:hypothetical protein ACE1B6_24545 [Aerosakkonemataceae cyanobacterium BLCC-F154]|uniref:Transposase n=1 Tax=Floridaenema fluviatile BLCC-F154 TaxID=3153640 RepID=A0ABV4YJQ6_9CYAN
MNNQTKQPDPEMIKRHVLNILLDKAIAQAEEDIRNSPLTAYRLRKAKSVTTKENISDS